jgi:hypothetical protein
MSCAPRALLALIYHWRTAGFDTADRLTVGLMLATRRVMATSIDRRDMQAHDRVC